MSFTYLRALPTPEEIKQQYPLSAKLAAIKADRDNQIKDIISGKDDRLFVDHRSLLRRSRRPCRRLCQPPCSGSGKKSKTVF